MRLKNVPPIPAKGGLVLAGPCNVMVEAVTSCRRLSIAPASTTIDLGTKMVILPLAPSVEVQLAAGSAVLPG
jgi:hypothetical protein